MSLLRKQVLYVCGPFRARRNPASQWEQHLNIRKAEGLALDLWALGFTVICPHMNTLHYQGELNDDVWLKGDLILLSRCDGLVTLPEWERSDGAKVEVRFATAHDIPVFHSIVGAYEYFMSLEKGDK